MRWFNNLLQEPSTIASIEQRKYGPECAPTRNPRVIQLYHVPRLALLEYRASSFHICNQMTSEFTPLCVVTFTLHLAQTCHGATLIRSHHEDDYFDVFRQTCKVNQNYLIKTFFFAVALVTSA
jgi:hypothetical protein